MITLTESLAKLGLDVVPFIRAVVVVLVLFIFFNIILSLTKRTILKKARNKRQKTAIENFSRLFKIIVFLFLVFIALFSYYGSLAGLGITAGLLTAALGWALQRPITGVAAWIMVVIKQPFNIGDRIIIGDVKGDVKEITLTHIIIDEVGGLVNADVPSGRVIMIPNYLLYELNIINYTKQDDYVISESVVQVTYESNLDKAIKIAYNAALTYTKEIAKKPKREPMIRIQMAGSGIDVIVRFYAEAHELQEVTSKVTKEIYDKIQKQNEVEIAYPHTELVFKNKNLFKK